MTAAGGPSNHQEMASIPWRHYGPCWAWCQSLSENFFLFVFSLGHANFPKGSAVGYLGPERSRSGSGKSCCLAVLPGCSSSESFPCMFIFGIYLSTTEVSAQSRAGCAELLRWPGGRCQLCYSPTVLGVSPP